MGGAGGDVLTGNGGNDSIIGGLSADTINVGDGTNVVVFTNGLTVDTISEYSSDDIGSFDLSELEQPNAVINGRTLDFVYGSNTSIVAGDGINIQEVNGAYHTFNDNKCLALLGSFSCRCSCSGNSPGGQR